MTFFCNSPRAELDLQLLTETIRSLPFVARTFTTAALKVALARVTTADAPALNALALAVIGAMASVSPAEVRVHRAILMPPLIRVSRFYAPNVASLSAFFF